jgi:hypothetical protein
MYMQNDIEIIETAIADEAFTVLVAQTSPDPVYLVKEYMLANEAKGIAEQRLTTLKPLIENLRNANKELFIPGKWRGKNGKYKILKVVTGQTRADMDVLKTWLANKKITQDDFNEATFWVDGSHNRVSWKAS